MRAWLLVALLHGAAAATPRRNAALTPDDPMPGTAPLVRALNAGDHVGFAKLMADGAAPDAVGAADVTNTTALMVAARKGDIGAAHLLLEHGADPLRKDSDGLNAMDAAAASKHPNLHRLMQEFVGESGMRRFKMEL